MVVVRVTRVAGETLADEGLRAGATRLDVEVLGAADETGTGETVRVSRVVVEVLADEPPTAAATRLDVEIVGSADTAGTGETVRVTRISGEVLLAEPPTAAATRLDVEVLGAAAEAGTGETVRVTRIVGEVLSRQGSAGPVSPLALNTDSEIFLHNWVNNATLRSSFLNDVRISPISGAESRRGLRIKPDRTMQLQWITNENERLDRLEVFLRRITDERFQVPIYMDQQELDQAYLSSASTINVNTRLGRFFQGARVVIVRLDACNQYVGHSFHLVQTLTSTSLTFTTTLGVAVPVNSLVLPVMDCEVLLEHETDYQAAKTAVTTLEVREVAGASALPALKSDNPAGFPVFDLRPIFTIEPDWIQGMKRGRSRQGDSYKQGRTELTFKAADRSRVTHEFLLTGKRDEMWPCIEFFDTRRGRLRSFWLTDQEQTFTISAIDATGNFVSVFEIGDFTDFNEEWDWLGLKMADGTEYVREVITVQQVLTVFRLTVNPPLPASLNVGDVVRVARARVTRFASDELVETWNHTGYMSTRLRFIEALNERDAPII